MPCDTQENLFESSVVAAGLSLRPTQNTVNHREQLAILIASGKVKEFVGVRLTHVNLTRLSEKDGEEYYKRYLVLQHCARLACKAVGMAIPIDSAEVLHKDLREDYIIQQELSSAAGLLSLKCGRMMALTSIT